MNYTIVYKSNEYVRSDGSFAAGHLCVSAYTDKDEAIVRLANEVMVTDDIDNVEILLNGLPYWQLDGELEKEYSDIQAKVSILLVELRLEQQVAEWIRIDKAADAALASAKSNNYKAPR